MNANFNCSYMARSSLTCIPDFSVKFFFPADIYRLCKLEKRVDEIKKKSSPRKLLSQYKPNFVEMILGWPPSKIVSVDPERKI
jgi:hypothetical protein